MADLSTRINVVVDPDGLPLRIVLSAGQACDKAAVAALIDGLPPAQALMADGGHDAQAIPDLVAAQGGVAHIPTKRDRKRQRNLRRALLLQIKHFQPIVTRFGADMRPSSKRHSTIGIFD